MESTHIFTYNFSSSERYRFCLFLIFRSSFSFSFISCFFVCLLHQIILLSGFNVVLIDSPIQTNFPCKHSTRWQRANAHAPRANSSKRESQFEAMFPADAMRGPSTGIQTCTSRFLSPLSAFSEIVFQQQSIGRGPDFHAVLCPFYYDELKTPEKERAHETERDLTRPIKALSKWNQ